MSRRSLLTLAISSFLATGCEQVPKTKLEVAAATLPENKNETTSAAKTEKDNRPKPAGTGFAYDEIYAALADGGFDVPAVNYRAIDPQYLRQEVEYITAEPAYSIVVDTNERFLYWVLPVAEPYVTAWGSELRADHGKGAPSFNGSRNGQGGRRRTI